MNFHEEKTETRLASHYVQDRTSKLSSALSAEQRAGSDSRQNKNAVIVSKRLERPNGQIGGSLVFFLQRVSGPWNL